MEWLLLVVVVAVAGVVAFALGRRRQRGLPEGVTDPAVRERMSTNKSSGWGGSGGNRL
jgi:hypothetical protein